MSQNVFDLIKDFLESVGIQIPTEIQTEKDLLIFINTMSNNLETQLVALSKKNRALRSAKEILEWSLGLNV